MAAINPYAPTPASLRGSAAAQNAGTAWRDGKLLVTLLDAELPHRCVKCNEPCEPPKKPRTIYWHHPAIYLLILVAVLIYLIVALATRRTARISAGLCERHRNKRRLTIGGAWAGVIAGFCVMVWGFNEGPGFAGLFGLLLLLGSMFYGVLAGRIVWAKRIDKQNAFVKGCGAEFLDTLPNWNAFGG
jgi:hypothetical protein